MECHELNDAWECDASRLPIALVEDWKAWFESTSPEYPFEVYDYQNNIFTCIKEFTTPMEFGMSLHYWTHEQMISDKLGKPIVVQKWVNATDRDGIPQEIYGIARQYYDGTEEEMKRELRCCGHIGWEDEENNWWVYGEYYDNQYSTGI